MTDPESSVPVRRAADAERDRAADLLRDAMTSGRLSVEELDDRLKLVFRAQTRPELERLVDDVLEAPDDRHPIASRAGAPPAGVTRAPVVPGEGGTSRLLAILGGSERKGRWRLAASCSVVNVLGGSNLDLDEVELAADHVELKVVSVLGGAEISVPEGMNVEISELSILGGNTVEIGDGQPDPGGPRQHLRLVSILGGSEVRRGRKLTRKERKALPK